MSLTPIDLMFRLTEVREIAEHAMAATQHRPSILDSENNTPGVASLMWCKDDGTYLMSSGIPRLLADADQAKGPSKVAYARGWGPGTGPQIGMTVVGGDDFAEHIALHEKIGSTTLIEVIRNADGVWMGITVRPNGTFEVWFDGIPSR
ncbi:hypothetical protein [Nocardia xishanensis]